LGGIDEPATGFTSPVRIDNYEWRADTNNGDTDCSQCFGQIDVEFRGLNDSSIVQDATSLRGYNVPTAVRLNDIAVRRANCYWGLVVALFGLVLILINVNYG
jgi:hypothetical protein